ncbi:MAG: hypothetical protein ACI31S_02135 [Bacilli bacterium]
MKIEKIDNENIKTYIKDLGIEATLDDEKSIVNTNTFGVKEEDKFLFGFISLPEDDSISITFGNKKIDDDIVKRGINFLNNSLSFNGHLIIQVRDNKLMDIMDELYRIKMIFVSKKNGEIVSSSISKEKYAEIDMRSIKYFYTKNGINCNLYSQNIQDEDVIKKLDDFFMECNTSSIDFCIIPDSYNYMKSLGYECISKRYVIDNN